MSTIPAPTSGVVTAVQVQPGQTVSAGQVLLSVELMKMVSEVKASSAGQISRINVAVGTMVQQGDGLIEFDERLAATEPDARQITADETPAAIEELRQRRRAISDDGRADRVQKRHAAGGRTARENLAHLLDEGSFSEMGAHALAAQRSKFDRDDLIDRSAADGVITGTGTINDIPVAVAVVDYTVMAGTQGFFHHKKIDRIVETAMRHKLPLILYPEGGGGRPNDVDAQGVSLAGLEVSSFFALAALRGKVPLIALVHGFCFAGSAAFAAVADVIVATQNASIGMGGPAMIEGGGLGRHAPQDVGPAKMHAELGTIDCLVADEPEGTELVRQLVAMLSGARAQPQAPQSTAINELMPLDTRTVFASMDILARVFDHDSILPLKDAWANNLRIGFARLDGRPVGFLASDCAHLGAAIDGHAAAKAAFLFRLCERHRLPVVAFIDTPGFMVGPEAEATGQVGPIGDLFVAAAEFRQPLISVVLRRAYGLGAMAMAGGSLHASSLTLSWPSGEFGAMGLEGAVRLGMRDKLAAMPHPDMREAAVQRAVADMKESGKALSAAALFEFDDVIEPDETRERLIKALAHFAANSSTSR